MINRAAIREAYEENLAAVHRIIPNPGTEDFRLCVSLAAEQTDHTEAEALSVMVDELAEKGAA